jgi:hypothetical protein
MQSGKPKQKVYYWNARLNGKTALLSGPFLTVAEAEATANHVSPAFLIEKPEAAAASFGVMECNWPGAGEGRYNDKLPPELLMAIAVENNLN